MQGASMLDWKVLYVYSIDATRLRFPMFYVIYARELSSAEKKRYRRRRQ